MRPERNARSQIEMPSPRRWYRPPGVRMRRPSRHRRHSSSYRSSKPTRPRRRPDRTLCRRSSSSLVADARESMYAFPHLLAADRVMRDQRSQNDAALVFRIRTRSFLERCDRDVQATVVQCRGAGDVPADATRRSFSRGARRFPASTAYVGLYVAEMPHISLPPSGRSPSARRPTTGRTSTQPLAASSETKPLSDPTYTRPPVTVGCP